MIVNDSPSVYAGSSSGLVRLPLTHPPSREPSRPFSLGLLPQVCWFCPPHPSPAGVRLTFYFAASSTRRLFRWFSEPSIRPRSPSGFPAPSPPRPPLPRASLLRSHIRPPSLRCGPEGARGLVVDPFFLFSALVISANSTGLKVVSASEWTRMVSLASTSSVALLVGLGAGAGCRAGRRGERLLPLPHLGDGGPFTSGCGRRGPAEPTVVLMQRVFCSARNPGGETQCASQQPPVHPTSPGRGGGRTHRTSTSSRHLPSPPPQRLR